MCARNKTKQRKNTHTTLLFFCFVYFFKKGRSGRLDLQAQGGGELWRALLTDPMSGDSLGELALQAPLAEEFRPFTGEVLEEGSWAASQAGVGPTALLTADPKFVRVLGSALALLTLAAVLGRWRVSGR